MGSVHGDALHLLRDVEAQAQRVLIGAVFSVHAAGRLDPELRHAQFRVGVGEGVVQRAHPRNFSQIGDCADKRLVGIKRQRVQIKLHRLVIVQLYRQPDLLVPGRGEGVRSEAFDANIVIPVHPHGRGHGHIPIRLGDTEIVVAVSAGGGQFQHLRRRFDILAHKHCPAVRHHFHAADGLVRGVAQENGDRRTLGLGDDAAHDRTVQRIINGEVAVLGGVDPAVLHGVVQRFLRQTFRQYHSPRFAGVAPLTFVVILVVGRRDVPALVQRQIIILAIHHAVFPGHFQQGDCRVILGAVVVEPLKIPMNGIRMVELADGTGDGGQRLIVIFQCCGHIFKIRLIPGLPAGGIEGGDMPQLLVLRPCHLKAEKPHKIPVGHGSGRLLPRRPVSADVRAIRVDGAHISVVKGIAVVGDGEKVQTIHLRRVLERFLHAPGAVGNIGVGVELTEVQIPVKVKFFRENDPGHFPGFAAPGDGICLEIRRSEVLFKANWPGIQRIGLVIHPVGGDCVINVGAFVLAGQGNFLPGADRAALGQNGHTGRRFHHFSRLLRLRVVLHLHAPVQRKDADVGVRFFLNIGVPACKEVILAKRIGNQRHRLASVAAVKGKIFAIPENLPFIRPGGDAVSVVFHGCGGHAVSVRQDDPVLRHRQVPFRTGGNRVAGEGGFRGRNHKIFSQQDTRRVAKERHQHVLPAGQFLHAGDLLIHRRRSGGKPEQRKKSCRQHN